MVDFPDNPSAGDLHTENGTQWRYSDPPGAWSVVATGVPVVISESGLPTSGWQVQGDVLVQWGETTTELSARRTDFPKAFKVGEVPTVQVSTNNGSVESPADTQFAAQVWGVDNAGFHSRVQFQSDTGNTGYSGASAYWYAIGEAPDELKKPHLVTAAGAFTAEASDARYVRKDSDQTQTMLGELSANGVLSVTPKDFSGDVWSILRFLNSAPNDTPLIRWDVGVHHNSGDPDDLRFNYFDDTGAFVDIPVQITPTEMYIRRVLRADTTAFPQLKVHNPNAAGTLRAVSMYMHGSENDFRIERWTGNNGDTYVDVLLRYDEDNNLDTRRRWHMVNSLVIGADTAPNAPANVNATMVQAPYDTGNTNMAAFWCNTAVGGLSGGLAIHNNNQWSLWLGHDTRNSGSKWNFEYRTTNGAWQSTPYWMDMQGTAWAAQAWTVNSDERGKMNAKAAPTLGDKFDMLIPRTYQRVAKLQNGDAVTNWLGIFAQDLQQVAPDAVIPVQVPTGTGDDDLEDRLSVDLQGLITVVIQAVHELRARVKELEAKLP